MRVDKIRCRRRFPLEVSTRDGSQFDFLMVIDIVMSEKEYAEYCDGKFDFIKTLVRTQ